jgi:PAS domain S-box-containing protein
MLEGVQIYDRDWRYVYINRQAEAQNRRPAEELLGRVFPDQWPGIEDTEVYRHMKRCMDEGSAQHLETVFVFPDGAEGVFEVFVESIPEGILVRSTDITERWDAERVSRESEERYRRLAENVTDVVWVLDLQTMRFAEVMAQPMDEVMLPESIQKVSELLGEALARWRRGEPMEITPVDVFQRHKDGSIVTTEVTARLIFDHEGAPIHVLGVSRDVTARRAAERALHAAKEGFEGIVNALPDLMFKVDREGRVTDYHTPSSDDLFVSPETFIGKKYTDLLPEEAIRAVEAAITEAARSGSHRGAIYQLSMPGGVRWYELSVGTMGGETGDFVVLSRDVTRRMELEKQVREREERLHEAQKLEAVGLLAGGVAHEFNNLLTSIMGYAQMLLVDPCLAGTGAAQDLQVILKEGRRAADLTRKMLALSRRQVMVPTVVPVNEAVLMAESAVRSALGHGDELVHSLDPAAGLVAVDAHQLERLLEHLATNAHDAMPDGGKLTVRTANVQLEGREAGALHMPPGPYVVLTVSDTGTGMSREAMAHLFEPFFTTKPQGKGTGLGLPVVRGIARQSGGGISVTSEPGAGTSVGIFLPRIDAQVSSSGGRQEG